MEAFRGRIVQPRKVRDQRDRMCAAALQRWPADWPPMSGPVGVRVWVTAARPKSHYLPANTRRPYPVLRADAATYCLSFPDLDKVLRLIGDALTDANVVRDDKIICRWEAARLYGDQPRTLVELFDLTRRETTP
jgi:Holliday junction resolvase RusA-like endonuclease